MFHGSGSYVGAAYHSEENSDSDGDDFTTTQYGASAGFFLNPNVEVYVEGSLYDETYADSYYSDYNSNGTQLSFGGAYHYRNFLDMDGNSLNLRLGAEYSTITIDGDWLDGIDATGTDMAVSAGGYLPMQLAGFNVTPFVLYTSHSMTVTLSYQGDTLETDEESTTTSIGMGVDLGRYVISPVMHLYEGGDTAFVLAGSMAI